MANRKARRRESPSPPTTAQRQPLFPLGRTLATTHAMRIAEQEGIDLSEFFLRHQGGDWGDIHPEDKGLNEAALEHGERIFSVYKEPGDLMFWVITEWDRSATTVMLSEDY